MIAKMKCSQCGAEMSNLTISPGKKYLLLMIPILVLGFLPMIKLMWFKPDPTKELFLSQLEKSEAGNQLQIRGLLTNKGKHSWSNVSLEAEFFDAQGHFIDEGSDHLRADIPAGAEEHFKITVQVGPGPVKAPDTKMVVKVTGGYTSPF